MLLQNAKVRKVLFCHVKVARELSSVATIFYKVIGQL